MKREIEWRNGYAVGCYTVEIDAAMREAALCFARQIVRTDNQYSRLLPPELRQIPDSARREQVEIQRTYVGKLGELAFARWLGACGKAGDTTDMLTVFEGQSQVDSFDFKTRDEATVDVKTGFLPNHRRLLVNTEQFDRCPKDIYVAVKLHTVLLDEKAKLVNWQSIDSAQILGYAEYPYMKQHAGVQDFGEGEARWLHYHSLLGIERLLPRF